MPSKTKPVYDCAMRILVAGASGVIGQRLVPLLTSSGHLCLGMTRSESNARLITQAGADALVCDVYDSPRLETAVSTFCPDLIWHLITDLPDDPSLLPQFAPANNRIRREGTANLLKAADLVKARIIAQSVAWQLPGDGGAAVSYLEKSVMDVGGIVVRYGQLYGPGTYYESTPPEHPRIHLDEAARRSLPAVDMGSGILVVKED